MAVKAVDAIFYRFLKSVHDQKRNNGSTQSDADAGDRNFMNGG